MRVANASGWNNPCFSSSFPSTYFPPNLFIRLFPSVQLARVVWVSLSLGFASNSKHFLAMRSHFSERLRVWFSISLAMAGQSIPPIFQSLYLQLSNGGFFGVLESLHRRKRSWRPQVLLQVQVQEGRKPALNIQDGAQPAPCFIGGFYETFRSHLEKCCPKPNWTGHLFGLSSYFQPFFLAFSFPKNNTHNTLQQ